MHDSGCDKQKKYGNSDITLLLHKIIKKLELRKLYYSGT